MAFTGCLFSKAYTDKSIIDKVSKDTAGVKQAAEFAVSVTYGQEIKEFLANDVVDKEMRNKISVLGAHVYVTYAAGSAGEIPDSNVTFKTITLAGVTEIIYDFAGRPRVFPENTTNRKSYYFIRLADRIYYRRRLFPMM
jgi:hypothetical protein